MSSLVKRKKHMFIDTMKYLNIALLGLIMYAEAEIVI